MTKNKRFSSNFYEEEGRVITDNNGELSQYEVVNLLNQLNDEKEQVMHENTELNKENEQLKSRLNDFKHEIHRLKHEQKQLIHDLDRENNANEMLNKLRIELTSRMNDCFYEQLKQALREELEENGSAYRIKVLDKLFDLGYDEWKNNPYYIEWEMK